MVLVVQYHIFTNHKYARHHRVGAPLDMTVGGCAWEVPSINHPLRGSLSTTSLSIYPVKHMDKPGVRSGRSLGKLERDLRVQTCSRNLLMPLPRPDPTLLHVPDTSCYSLIIVPEDLGALIRLITFPHTDIPRDGTNRTAFKHQKMSALNRIARIRTGNVEATISSQIEVAKHPHWITTSGPQVKKITISSDVLSKAELIKRKRVNIKTRLIC